jgi:ATP-dependent Clp endopeptidase proteolytic subunit ClpP
VSLLTSDPYIREFFRHTIKEKIDTVDLFTRTIRFHDAVESYSINELLGYITMFQHIHATLPVTVVINSLGGNAYDALHYYDQLRLLKIKVDTLVSGCAMSAASVMSIGTTGKRLITPNSFIMIHEISSWEMGEVSKLKNRVKHVERMQELLINMYVEHSKEKDRKKWEEVLQQETYFTAQQALDLGLVDGITV